MLLVTVCGYLVGSIYANKLKKREEFLSQFIILIDNFDELIRYKDMNVKELIKWAISSGEYSELEFLQDINFNDSFDKQWVNAIEDKKYKDFLKESDISEIKSIGTGLGESDKIGQSAHLKLHSKMLNQKLSDAKNECTVKGKLYKKIGLLVGIAIAIMLI